MPHSSISRNSFSAAISACFNAERFSEALRLARRSQEKGFYPNFLKYKSAKWDLHDLQLATACMLLADALLVIGLTGSHKSSSFREIVVVTGKGLRSGSEGPVLRDKVPQFLQERLGLETTPVEENTGRFLVKQTALQTWTESGYGTQAKHQMPCALLKVHDEWTSDDCMQIDAAFSIDP